MRPRYQSDGRAALKTESHRLDRDVIFLAESGVEADTAGVGINFMVEKHYEEIDAEFPLTEAGWDTIEAGRVVRINIGTAEKLPARVRLIATGTSGHGSAPSAFLFQDAARIPRQRTGSTADLPSGVSIIDTTHTSFLFHSRSFTKRSPDKLGAWNKLVAEPLYAPDSQ